MAARRLMFVNYVFNIDMPDRAEFVARSVELLRDFLDGHH